MAAKTFTLTSNSTSASQILDATTSGILFTGDARGGRLNVEVSQDNTNWGALTYDANFAVSRPGTYNAYYQVAIPGGWRVRVSLNNADTTVAPNAIVVIE